MRVRGRGEDATRGARVTVFSHAVKALPQLRRNASRDVTEEGREGLRGSGSWDASVTGAPAGKEKTHTTELEERALVCCMHIIPLFISSSTCCAGSGLLHKVKIARVVLFNKCLMT